MQKITFLSFILLGLMSETQASIHRVNNSDNSAGYSTVQAAINDDLNVFDGDTLFVEGSAFPYPGFTLDKQLYIIGPGYFLGENPKTSNSGASTVIAGGAIFSSGAEGSVLMGVIFSDDLGSYEPMIQVDNISIVRCFLQEGLNIDSDCNNLAIIQCYFNDDLYRDLGSTSFQNVTLKNNIFSSAATINFGNDAGTPTVFGAVENNLFLASVAMTTSTFRNNIWLPLSSSNINIKSGTVENNLIFNGNLGLESGNMGFSSSNDVFGDQTGRSFDEKWALDSASTYKNSGKDGTDPGVFGGSNPYVLSGVPPLPIIYEISTPGFGNQQDGLPVTIKIRSN
ncbi:MAG: hypothetical protein KI790_01020 [Cyclobacteriaceae bacterium]|nr:hypothetical protein [Cyclobacteriaceae bacterium HetDA_MAG_MS6]